ncbi:MAG: 3-deoxy-D-manno-octulosonic acid transferase [Opitutales bacterium]
MIVLYRILFVPVLVAVLPYYLRRMWRRGGYRQDAAHRFGFVPVLSAPAPGKRRLWLQAVSVGELQAIESLVDALNAEGHWEIVLTTTTSTGYRLARERFRHKVLRVALFPLDFWACTALAWRRIRPDVVALMEGELWPEHLHQAARKNVPVLLLNARLSDRSFGRYRRLSWVARWLFSRVHRILASSQPDAQRFRELSPHPDRIRTVGNLKFDAPVEPRLDPGQREDLRAEMGLQATEDGARPLVLLGCSTWPGEEAFLLRVMDAAEARKLPVRLLLIPRHAERRGEIMDLLRTQPRPWHLRSRKEPPPANARIYVADTTGEMRTLIQAADVAFIGKSLPPNNGGQTPLECAAFGIPMAYGPNMTNFRQACRELQALGGSRCAEEQESLRGVLIELLSNPTARGQMSTASRKWHTDCRGATERTRLIFQEFAKPSK